VAAALDPRVRKLAQAPNFATLSVILRSGRPMTHVMWVDAEADHVLINEESYSSPYDHRLLKRVIDGLREFA